MSITLKLCFCQPNAPETISSQPFESFECFIYHLLSPIHTPIPFNISIYLFIYVRTFMLKSPTFRITFVCNFVFISKEKLFYFIFIFFSFFKIVFFIFLFSIHFLLIFLFAQREFYIMIICASLLGNKTVK